MKKRIHILTVRDHHKMFVEPYVRWEEERHSGKYSKGFFFHGELLGTKYPYFVSSKNTGNIAHFISSEAAQEFCNQKNAELPPIPDPPPPPLPIGTYYLLDAAWYEIRQIVRPTKSNQEFRGDGFWETKTSQPYPLVKDHILSSEEKWKQFRWQEWFIAHYDDRDEALAHLKKLVLKK